MHKLVIVTLAIFSMAASMRVRGQERTAPEPVRPAPCSNPDAPRIGVFTVSPVRPHGQAAAGEQFGGVSRFVEAFANEVNASGACAVTAVGKESNLALTVTVNAAPSARTPGWAALSLEFSAPRGRDYLARTVLLTFPVLLEAGDDDGAIAAKARAAFAQYNSFAKILSAAHH